MQLSSGSHCVFNLKAHLIFAVAYRRKVISSTILERLKELFSEVCRRDRVRLMECSGEEDHVHLLISYPPTICLSTIMFPCLFNKAVLIEHGSLTNSK
ncbi:IS200/IS605 family transposase [Parasutterella sp.]|nr:IS200/IS605 family transposase [Candidatus Parasutterella gallistercoris]